MGNTKKRKFSVKGEVRLGEPSVLQVGGRAVYTAPLWMLAAGQQCVSQETEPAEMVGMTRQPAEG